MRPIADVLNKLIPDHVNVSVEYEHPGETKRIVRNAMENVPWGSPWIRLREIHHGDILWEHMDRTNAPFERVADGTFRLLLSPRSDDSVASAWDWIAGR